MQIVQNGKTLAIVVGGKKFRRDDLADYALRHALLNERNHQDTVRVSVEQALHHGDEGGIDHVARISRRVNRGLPGHEQVKVFPAYGVQLFRKRAK